jgi:Protein of unknown function (DUF3617)
MSRSSRIAAISMVPAVLCLGISIAWGSGIEPGLWKITSRTESGGMIGPPHTSSKCLTAAEASDVATTFSPVGHTVNSTCAPIERSFDGKALNWRLVCKGQLDMELDGKFNFDSSRHYTASVHSKAVMLGRTMVDSVQMLDAQWVSACPQ